MKSPTTNLTTLLEERESKLRLKAELEAKLLANKLEKDKIINESSGPDDGPSLSRLELLNAHQSMTSGKLELLNRELEGCKLQISGETAWVKRKAVELLGDRRDKIMARLRRKLEEFYPGPDGAALVDRLIRQMENEVTLPPEVRILRKSITGISSQHGPNLCPVDFARSIKTLVDNAFARWVPEAEEQA